MRTQFYVTETTVLKNGKIVLAGSVTGPLLVAGQSGSTPRNTKVEIVSIGLLDSTRVKPNMQALHVKVVGDDPATLKGETITFEGTEP